MLNSIKKQQYVTLAVVRYIMRNEDGTPRGGFASSNPKDLMGDIFIGGIVFASLKIEEGDTVMCTVEPSNAPKKGKHHAYWFSARTQIPTEKQMKLVQASGSLPEANTPFNTQITKQLKTLVNNPEEDVIQHSFPTFDEEALEQGVADILLKTNDDGELMLWQTIDVCRELVDKKWWQDKTDMEALQKNVWKKLSQMQRNVRQGREILYVEVKRSCSKANSKKGGKQAWGLHGVTIRLPYASCD